MTQHPHIRRSEEAGVLTLTLTRDAKLNAVSPEMRTVIEKAVTDFGDDPKQRVLVFAAEGRYFTAGMDIARMKDADKQEKASTGITLRHDYRQLHKVFDELEAIEKPVVHAAQGPCLGVGVELCVSCDFRLASENASYGLPEIPVLGTIAGSGGISRMTRLVGPHWARWIAMAPNRIDAGKAELMGLVHAVYAQDEFEREVRKFARSLVELSSEALGLAKLAIDSAAASDRVSARNFDRVANTLLRMSPDHLAKIDAFNAKKSAK